MDNNYLATLKRDISKLDFNSFGLIGSNGKWIMRPNSARNGSNLDQIFTMLETLPPDNYRVYCTKYGRNKDAGFEYQVSTQSMQTATNVHPQFATNPIQDNERFCKLERDNAILLERIDALNAAIAGLSESNDDDDDFEDDSDDDDYNDLADEPTTTQKAIEILTPIVPQVVDRLLSIMDNFIAKQQQPIPNGGGTLNDPGPQIDYELLATMVANKLKNEYDPV
jgi:hypothetical protein